VIRAQWLWALVILLSAGRAAAQSEAFVRPGVHATVDAMLAPGATQVAAAPVNCDVDADSLVDALLQLDAEGRTGLVLARRTQSGWTGTLVAHLAGGGEHELAWDNPVSLGGRVFLITVHGARGANGRGSNQYELLLSGPGDTLVHVFTDQTREAGETWSFAASGDGEYIIVTSSRRRIRTLTYEPDHNRLTASAWQTFTVPRAGTDGAETTEPPRRVVRPAPRARTH
jgi:hypothetical protein